MANVPDYGSEEVADTALAHDDDAGPRRPRDELAAAGERGTLVVPAGRAVGAASGQRAGRGRPGTDRHGRWPCAARPWAWTSSFYDPYKPDGYDKALGIRRVETLDELLAQAMVVSLHCPLTDETHHMLDAAAIAKMPQGSYLVNTARGGDRRHGGRARGDCRGPVGRGGDRRVGARAAAADDPLLAVWRDPSHPAHHRLIVTPHAAFYSEQGLMDIRRKTSEACRRALLGMPLRNVVN